MSDMRSKLQAFKLKAHDGSEISLSQYRGKWVVSSAFPFAFTGG